MNILEPEPGFYVANGYKEYEKDLLHNATVSILKIYIYKIWVTYLTKFYFLHFLIEILTKLGFKLTLWYFNNNCKNSVFIVKSLFNLTIYFYIGLQHKLKVDFFVYKYNFFEIKILLKLIC